MLVLSRDGRESAVVGGRPPVRWFRRNDTVAGRINLRVQQLDVKIETKTEDNVFVQMVVAVQFYVLPEKVYDAFCKLDDARLQITSYVFDVVRAQVPKIKLDDVFEKKDDIANIVKAELAQVMEGFEYGILKALVFFILVVLAVLTFLGGTFGRSAV